MNSSISYFKGIVVPILALLVGVFCFFLFNILTNVFCIQGPCGSGYENSVVRLVDSLQYPVIFILLIVFIINIILTFKLKYIAKNTNTENSIDLNNKFIKYKKAVSSFAIISTLIAIVFAGMVILPLVLNTNAAQNNNSINQAPCIPGIEGCT